MPLCTFASDELVSSYLLDAQRKIKTLVSLTFNGKVSIKDITQGPSGVFFVKVKHLGGDKKGLSERLYVLSDLSHIIRGKLYSPHETNIEQVADSDYFVDLVQKNEERRLHVNTTLNTPSKAQTQSAPDIVQHSKASLGNGLLTLEKLKQQATKPLFNVESNVNNLFERVTKSNFVIENPTTSNKHLYIFYDHECPACFKAEKYLMPLAEKYDIELRYIPIGAQSTSSLGKAELVLTQESQEKRRQLKKLFLSPKPLKSLVSFTGLDKEVFESNQYKQAKEARLLNEQILRESPRAVTPAMFYLTTNGPAFRVASSGKSIEEMMQEIIASKL